jgi:hypothetical protein
VESKNFQQLYTVICQLLFATDISAGQLINPDRTPPEVDSRASRSHDLYRRSHNDYYEGEHFSRNYTHPSFDATRRFGLATPHDNAGSATYKSLKWIQFTEAEKATPTVNLLAKKHRERTHWKLGKTLDPCVCAVF